MNEGLKKEGLHQRNERATARRVILVINRAADPGISVYINLYNNVSVISSRIHRSQKRWLLPSRYALRAFPLFLCFFPYFIIARQAGNVHRGPGDSWWAISVSVLAEQSFVLIGCAGTSLSRQHSWRAPNLPKIVLLLYRSLHVAKRSETSIIARSSVRIVRESKRRTCWSCSARCASVFREVFRGRASFSIDVSHIDYLLLEETSSDNRESLRDHSRLSAITRFL